MVGGVDGDGGVDGGAAVADSSIQTTRSNSEIEAIQARSHARTSHMVTASSTTRRTTHSKTTVKLTTETTRLDSTLDQTLDQTLDLMRGNSPTRVAKRVAAIHAIIDTGDTISMGTSTGISASSITAMIDISRISSTRSITASSKSRRCLRRLSAQASLRLCQTRMVGCDSSRMDSSRRAMTHSYHRS